jgi:exopolysaccharide biosynthesis protein
MTHYILFLIIFLIFLVFTAIQIYFYHKKYRKNNIMIQKMESFQNTIEKYDKYTLDDNSIERLMEDYGNIRSTV